MDIEDDDIEFDFFEDEPATTEGPSPRVRLPRRPGGPRRRVGPARPVAPLLRLLLLITLVVFLVVVFGLLVQSCASASKHDAYASYMNRVAKIASQSATNGKALADVLTTPGLSVTTIETKLRGVADSEQQNVAAAENANPPGRLRDENQHVVESLQLRVAGAQGLAAAFQKTAKSKDTTTASALLAAQGLRLIASDVIWSDLFKALAVQQLEHDGVSGVTVPDSQFVSNPDLLSSNSMKLVLQRIQGAATGGTTVTGLHGTQLVSVTAEPGGQVLNAGTITTVTANTDLSFQVVVNDSGNFQEVQIPVTLTIDRPQAQGGPIVKTQTIAVVNPGESATLTFTNLGQVPFASQTKVNVDVKGVTGEVNLSNNSASYDVIFSLP